MFILREVLRVIGHRAVFVAKGKIEMRRGRKRFELQRRRQPKRRVNELWLGQLRPKFGSERCHKRHHECENSHPNRALHLPETSPRTGAVKTTKFSSCTSSPSWLKFWPHEGVGYWWGGFHRLTCGRKIARGGPRRRDPGRF